MKTFQEMSRDLDTQNVNKAIQHDWATHIKHPSLGEDFVKVVDHSLTEDGVIEEYYVTYTGTLLTIQANEVTEEHGGSHSHEKKPKKKKKWNRLKNMRWPRVNKFNKCNGTGQTYLIWLLMMRKRKVWIVDLVFGILN